MPRVNFFTRKGGLSIADRLLWRRWLRALMLTLFTLPLLLVFGQLAKLRWLWPLDLEALQALPGLLWGALLALLAVALPLCSLIASGLLGASLRGGDALTLSSLGYPPWRVLIVPLLGGGILALVAHMLAAEFAPRQLPALRATLERLTLSRLERGGEPVSFRSGGAWLEEEGAQRRLWLSLPQGDQEALGINLQLAHPQLKRVGEGDEAQLSLTGRSLWLWGSTLRLRLDEAALTLPLKRLLEHRLRSLGAPNDRVSAALDAEDPHHRFTGARRVALPAMAPLWGALGLTRGQALPGAAALLACAGSAAGAYTLLRAGELRARRGAMDPCWAAWRPFTSLSLFLFCIQVLVFWRGTVPMRRPTEVSASAD